MRNITGKLLTTEEFIERSKSVWGDRFDYSKAIYKDTFKKVCLIDKNFNNFEIWINPASHLRGQQPRHTVRSFKDFIILAEFKYPNKYDYYLAEKEFENYSSNKKIPFIEKSTSIVFYQSAKDFLKRAPLCLSTEQFIEIATSIYGNTYDYSNVNFVDMTTKVEIICKKHNKSFSKTPRSFLIEKHGCPYCEQEHSLEKSTKTEEKRIKRQEKFIQKAKEVHGDNYDYSEVYYIDSETPVKIKCKKHNNEFFQKPKGHLSGSTGCEFCIKEKLSISSKSKKTNNTKRLTTEEFIKRAKEIHGDKYDYSLVNYINLYTKVEIICKTCGDHFWMDPNNHLHGKQGCPICAQKEANIKISQSKTLTTEEFIKRARTIHGDKYDYSLVEYKDMTTPVKIIYPIDGIFEQKPSLHLRGSGCQICAQRNLKMSTEEFIQRAKEIHGDKYDYSKVVYSTINNPVEIICNIHHTSFFQSPGAHLYSEAGCPLCRADKIAGTTEDFIKKAIDLYGKDRYDYSKVNYVRSDKKITIICKEHNTEFEQTPKAHLQGYEGCPICKNTKFSGEIYIKNWLICKNIKFNIYQKFEGLKSKRSLNVDIFLPDHNLAIEYQGEQHYHLVQFKGISEEKAEETFKETLARDKIKEEYFKNSNTNLLCIHYKDYDKIDEILEKVIIEKDYEYLKTTNSYIF